MHSFVVKVAYGGVGIVLSFHFFSMTVKYYWKLYSSYIESLHVLAITFCLQLLFISVTFSCVLANAYLYRVSWCLFWRENFN
jgi:hypothetical protein